MVDGRAEAECRVGATGTENVTAPTSLLRFRDAEAAPADSTHSSDIDRHDRMSRWYLHAIKATHHNTRSTASFHFTIASASQLKSVAALQRLKRSIAPSCSLARSFVPMPAVCCSFVLGLMLHIVE